MKTTPVRMLITLCLLHLMSGYTHACDCVGASTVQELAGRSSAIFSGRVVNVSSTKNAAYVTIAVEQVWKGNIVKTTQVTDGPPTRDCNVGFAEGKEYLVYASFREDIDGNVSSELHAGGACGGTREILDAQKDLSVLGKSYQPLSNPVGATPLRWTAALFSLCGIVALLWYSRKRSIPFS